MATHSSTPAWQIPWMEEPGRLQSMGLLRVGYDWATSLSLFTFMHWRRKWQPTPVFLPGESQGRGAWWAAVYEVAQSQTQLKWLSSSSSSIVLKQHTNENEFNLLWVSFALFKPCDIIQIGSSGRNVLWKKLERMSLWMDDYKSIPILDKQPEETVLLMMSQ